MFLTRTICAFTFLCALLFCFHINSQRTRTIPENSSSGELLLLLRDCLGECFRGTCFAGHCECDDGWSGILCRDQSPLQNSSCRVAHLTGDGLFSAVAGGRNTISIVLQREGNQTEGCTFFATLRGPEIIELVFFEERGSYTAHFSPALPGVFNLTILLTGKDFIAYNRSVGAVVIAVNVSVVVTGTPHMPVQERMCNEKDTHGRWVQAHHLKDRLAGRSWHKMATFDREGYIWIPSTCSYEYYEQFPASLSNCTITLLGDSHVRTLWFIFYNFFLSTASLPEEIRTLHATYSRTFTVKSTNTTVRFTALTNNAYKHKLKHLLGTLHGTDILVVNSAQWIIEQRGLEHVREDVMTMFLALLEWHAQHRTSRIIWQGSPDWNPFTKSFRSHENLLITNTWSASWAKKLGIVATDAIFYLSSARRTETPDGAHYALPIESQRRKESPLLYAPVVFSQMQILLCIMAGSVI